MGNDKNKKAEIERLCKFCELAAALKDSDEMLCRKRGVVSAGYHCHSFRYDPLKRDPGKTPKLVIPELPDADDLI